MAKELLEVYAAREAHGRPAYGTEDGLYEEFAARFPFEETPDQQHAIDDVLADLGREKPMDRLVCGGAGFGKTPVAVRAGFGSHVAADAAVDSERTRLHSRHPVI